MASQHPAGGGGDPDDVITLDHVGKTYRGGAVAVADLSLSFPRGTITALLGPSGCGKTTTLRMINRLIEPTSGRICIEGRDISGLDPVALRRSIGYVIQQVGLFPHRTVAQNVATVCELQGWDARRTAERVREMLALVGLDPREFGGRYPAELSGGQRQRVGVARALAAEPAVLLMDEPFGAVDPLARGRLQTEFRALQRRLGTTVVMVTHDVSEAVQLADRIVVLGEGGRCAQVGDPISVLRHPADAFVAEFLGTERALTRLAVTPLSLERLQPLTNGGAGVDRAPLVAADSDVRTVLAALVDAPDGFVVVGDRTVRIGLLTAADVLAGGR